MWLLLSCLFFWISSRVIQDNNIYQVASIPLKPDSMPQMCLNHLLHPPPILVIGCHCNKE